ncbi:MAG: BamA/TamA family outer membrane protein [Elusimicrobia bacterium]|nr:BamA/TamA family outer membrane protein [Elusimicrobiota bacterium]
MLGQTGRLAWLAAALSWAPAAGAQPSDAVSDVRVERLNVFDPRVPGENWWPFRIANKIHFISKESVLRRELLLGPGDRWDKLKALESERNMRFLGFFRKAEVRPERRPDGKLDLAVYTQDAWTTNVFVSAGTEGGENFFTYGASEDNLLGYGKSIGFSHSQVGSKISNDLRYSDPRFLGSRVRLSPFYTQSQHGDSVGIELARPFFSVDTPYAGSFSASRTNAENQLFQNASESTKFLRSSRQASASLGMRLGRDPRLVQRGEVGWEYQRDRFSELPQTAPGTLPANREFSGPALRYSWVQPRYVKETYINKMERVEDFNMGNELSSVFWFQGEYTGSTRDRWLVNVADQQGLSLSEGRFLLGQAGMSGRVAQGRWENSLLYGSLNLFWKTQHRLAQTWVAHLEGNFGHNLDSDAQMVLGGNTGLRGYKNNSFTGAKSALLNLENRFFLPGEYLHLLRFGGVVFFDSGVVLPQAGGYSLARFKSDVGVGLRMSSTRSQSGGVIRIDLAYALNRGPGPSRWVVSVRGQQAFQIFNSTSRGISQGPGSKLGPVK